MSKWSRTDIACPCGKSSDGFATDKHGGGFCFSGGCNRPFSRKQLEGNLSEDMSDEEEQDRQNVEVHHEIKSHRGLSRKTIQFYDINTSVKNGEDFSYVFKYPNGSFKTKRINPKSRSEKYAWHGDSTNAGLFGLDKFQPGGKVIVITEGEHDAPSVYEALGGSIAAVSVQSSVVAYRDINLCRDKLNSFEKIIIAFDNDEAGDKAMRKVMTSGLFDFNKLFYITWDTYKDANDFAQAGDFEGLIRCYKSAKKYTPDHIISGFSEIFDALEESQEEGTGEYPTHELREMLGDIRRGQVITCKGMEGLGKTELFRILEYHLLKTTDCRLGLIHMEEPKARTIKGVATYELGLPTHLDDSPVTREDIHKAYVDAVGNREDRVFIYTMFGGDDPDDVLDSIRFLVASGGVDVVFLDHISLLVTGLEEGDERRRLDYLSTKLKKMVMELRFALFLISHVNDDGQTRGSRNITKISDVVIDLKRDLPTDGGPDNNILELFLEKNRPTGKRGFAGKLLFNMDTYKLEEL